MRSVLFSLVSIAIVAQAFAIGSGLQENLRRSTAQNPTGIRPVVECVDSRNRAYFSYINYDSRDANIPLSDQNRLTPLNTTPYTDFPVLGSAPGFPFSVKLSLSGYETSNFTWTLGNYDVSFTITPEVACPTVFNMSLVFFYQVAWPFPIPENITGTIANLVGISPEQILVLASTSEGPDADKWMKNTLDIQVIDGNLTEPTAADAITDFYLNQVNSLAQIILQINQVSNVSIASLKWAVVPEIFGQSRTPISGPSPVEPASAPSSSNTPSMSAPVSGPKPKTSNAQVMNFSIEILVLLVVSMIFLQF